ncbi:hypothetical protein BKA70DRAFT_1415001 [Coprinopsis sp. MPI-PUGE-AT-0042]|nr:hypothetical protein BKA70DRAFT_1415001 [Coprinopsis sp. MPI-PUGE-AT-0042]
MSLRVTCRKTGCIGTMSANEKIIRRHLCDRRDNAHSLMRGGSGFLSGMSSRRPTTFRIIDPGSPRLPVLPSPSRIQVCSSREAPPRSGRLPACPLGSSIIGCETATLYTKRSSKVPWWSKWRSSQNTTSRHAKDNYGMNSSSWPEHPSQASKEFQPKEQWPHEASCLQIQKHQLSKGHVVSLAALESDYLSILQAIEIAADAIWMHSFPPEIQRWSGWVGDGLNAVEGLGPLDSAQGTSKGGMVSVALKKGTRTRHWGEVQRRRLINGAPPTIFPTSKTMIAPIPSSVFHQQLVPNVQVQFDILAIPNYVTTSGALLAQPSVLLPLLAQVFKASTARRDVRSPLIASVVSSNALLPRELLVVEAKSVSFTRAVNNIYTKRSACYGGIDGWGSVWTLFMSPRLPNELLGAIGDCLRNTVNWI